jgi:DNA-binding XRE family transcriptional regulator
MDKNDFSKIRTELRKTQAQMAELLRVSLKAIQSYEQGWRSIPVHVERQMLFLWSLKSNGIAAKPCWTVKQCSREKRMCCPAWEFKAGRFCWFINGTVCEGNIQRSWKEKMRICRSCEVMASALE